MERPNPDSNFKSNHQQPRAVERPNNNTNSHSNTNTTNRLALWSALVFFRHGSEMQLATALVINVVQLCVHIQLQPMGGAEGKLLNRLETGTLVLTTYINYGAFSMNYLLESKELARHA